MKRDWSMVRSRPSPQVQGYPMDQGPSLRDQVTETKPFSGLPIAWIINGVLLVIVLTIALYCHPNGGSSESVFRSSIPPKAYVTGMADLYQAAADKADAGEFSDLVDMYAYLATGKKAINETAFAPYANLLETLNGENWDQARAANIAETIAKDYRSCK